MVLFSPRTWAVRELEKGTLAHLRDPNFSAHKLAIFRLSGREKSGGCCIFSRKVAERGSNSDKLGSGQPGIL